MKDKKVAAPSLPKLEQARKLMEQGQYRESLLLALEGLLQELNNLRESLIALQIVTRLEAKAHEARPVKEEPPQPETFWLPPVKTRVLH